jgi:conjugative transfer signal peptidase TraF
MRIRPAGLRLQIMVLALIAAAYVAMLVASQVRAPLVIFNGSASAPLGFYHLENRLPFRGETAAVAAPPAVELMVAAYGVLHKGLPLIKQIAAIGGDEVCRFNAPSGTISINGKVIAEVQEMDREGRRLPKWEGCIRLVEGEYFLLQPHPHSFDSRYFGPVMKCDILGTARPIWTWGPDG